MHERLFQAAVGCALSVVPGAIAQRALSVIPQHCRVNTGGMTPRLVAISGGALGVLMQCITKERRAFRRSST